MKIVFDTNVLIAAFISHGVCQELFEHCVKNHEIIVSDFIYTELKKHLSGKFNYSRAELKQVTDLLESRLYKVDVTQTVADVCRDKDDDMILATAWSAEADGIVTGDKDLLDLKEFQGIRILRPNEFWHFERG